MGNPSRFSFSKSKVMHGRVVKGTHYARRLLMRLFVVIWFLSLAICRAQMLAAVSAQPPDWKILFEQANESGAKWKERARTLEAENEAMKDQITLLSARLKNDPIQVAADEKRRKEALIVAQANATPPVQIYGKVLSVARDGIIVSCAEQSALVPDKLCFLETDSSRFLDGQTVNLLAGQMPSPYEYSSVNGAKRRVPRFHPVAGTPAATPPLAPMMPRARLD